MDTGDSGNRVAFVGEYGWMPREFNDQVGTFRRDAIYAVAVNLLVGPTGAGRIPRGSIAFGIFCKEEKLVFGLCQEDRLSRLGGNIGMWWGHI